MDRKVRMGSNPIPGAISTSSKTRARVTMVLLLGRDFFQPCASSLSVYGRLYRHDGSLIENNIVMLFKVNKHSILNSNREIIESVRRVI